MDTNKWYDSFLEALYKKYPQKPQLTEALMDLLSIEREAVYRRLRNDVVFPSGEIIKIASSWGISLDEILGNHSPYIQTFKVMMHQYINPSPQELETMQQMVDFLEDFNTTANAEYIEVSNMLSRSLITGFPHLARYYIFKWAYQYSSGENALPFSQVAHLEKIRQLGANYYRKFKNIPVVNYIWDYMIFEYLVNDIKYFTSIYLITEEEKQLIKNDIYALLDYMSEVSSKGCFPETGNTINLYISHINIHTNYSCYYSDTVKVSRVRAFVKHEMTSVSEELADYFRHWANLKKKSSTKISGVDEKSRIEFFMKQRQLIDSL